MKTKKRFRVKFLFAFFCLSSLSLMAQEINVTGTVSAAEGGLPLPGVSVYVKNTSTGVVTDFDGVYSITVAKGSLLEFSYTGMNTQVRKVEDSGKIDVLLETAAIALDDVVVIGYGSVKKSELIGAVTQVRAEEIEQLVTTDLGTALQGIASGVTVTSSGELGGTADVFIRGIGSPFGSQEPLYVVDGIPQNGNPNLNPNEIETLEVFKDAATAAVYGSRGANGVINITTKRGKAGPARINFRATTGVRSVISDLNFLSSRQALLINNLTNTSTARELITRNGSPAGSSFFNESRLLDVILVDNAITNNYSASFSGGSEKFTYSLVSGFFEGQGSTINQDFERFNSRLNTGYKSGKWQIRTGFGFTLEEGQRAGGRLLSRGLAASPLISPIDPDADVFEVTGDEVGQELSSRGFASNDIFDKRRTGRDRFNGNISLNYKISDNLSATTRSGFVITNSRERGFRRRTEVLNITTGILQAFNPESSFINLITSRGTEFSWDGSLTYTKNIGKNHKITATGAVSFEERKFESFTVRASDILDNRIQTLEGANGNLQAVSGSRPQNLGTGDINANRTERIIGNLLRVQYDYKKKYLLSALIRRDGSSKFGDSNRFGYFPSVSLGWTVSKEKFWKKYSGTVNNFKIRASWGTTGNERIPTGQTQITTQFGRNFVTSAGNSEALAPGEFVNSISSPDLKWETTIQKNLGVDLSFFKNKITFTADYYESDKSDLLFNLTFPASSGTQVSVAGGGGGGNRTRVNIGDVNNKGIEFALGYRNKEHEFKWSANATFTKNVNEVTSVPKGPDGKGVRLPFGSQSISGQGTNRGIADSNVSFIEEGFEAGAFFLFETDGILRNQAEVDDYITSLPNGNVVNPNVRIGDLRFVDTDNDGDLDVDDKRYFGSSLPDFELGLRTNFEYKNFDFRTQWYASVGGKIYNGGAAETFLRRSSVQLLNQFNEFSNPNSNIPNAGSLAGNTGNPNAFGNTDRYLEDGDFVRLKNVQLGYNMPKKFNEKLGIRKLRFFFTADNLLTFTKYSGFDPEVGSNSGGNGGAVFVTRGIESGRSPVTRLYSLGINLDF